MSFLPPRCPNTGWPVHVGPAANRIIRWGYFPRRCRERREPRFRCLGCRKSFSRQTFRSDYRDRRPDCKDRLFELLTSGVGLSQAACVIKIAASSAQKKMRKLLRTCELMHENLSRPLPPDRAYVMDKEETYENASIRPLASRSIARLR